MTAWLETHSTITMTPTATGVPTEPAPEPLQNATYLYDGDGNLVKSAVNSRETYYLGKLYQKKIDGTEVTIQKYYSSGSAQIAVRTIQGESDTLQWLLSDHLGSTSITANSDGSWNSTIQYTAFGEIRASSGITATEFRYTGQLRQAELGLYYYVARWYDPQLGHFTQADTIVPNAGDSAAYDRYAYTMNNPIKYTDPNGHMYSCGDGTGGCGGDTAQSRYFESERYYRTNSFYGWWTGRNKYYSGSGGILGHGLRRFVAEKFDIGSKATNVWGVVLRGLLQENRTTIVGRGLEKIKKDPAVTRSQEDIINKIHKNPSYGEGSFSKTYIYPVDLGGSTSDKFGSAMNELTWMIRATNIKADVSVNRDKSMKINYSLINDKLDLRPDWSNRTIPYNLVTSMLGMVYHDEYGGNDQMVVTANWSVYIP